LLSSSLIVFPDLILASGGVSIDRSSGWLGLLIAFVALSAMEIVLGIDNIIFISIATSKLPVEQQKKARLIGLGLAMAMRILLLCFIAMIASWTKPLFVLSDLLPASLTEMVGNGSEIDQVSIRDMILFGGGLFLIFQSVREIHHVMDVQVESAEAVVKRPSFGAVLLQIAFLDIVFSLDSVITAVGMVDNVQIMIASVVLAVLIMMLFAGAISRFVMSNPSIKVLALSFLLMIGVMLVAEGFGSHFNKNYVYFAMAFSLAVELLNLRMRKKHVLKSA
jgi:predicted tellurium resistance membrane protein TerC